VRGKADIGEFIRLCLKNTQDVTFARNIQTKQRFLALLIVDSKRFLLMSSIVSTVDPDECSSLKIAITPIPLYLVILIACINASMLQLDARDTCPPFLSISQSQD